jgi:hypothetical protein
MNNTKTGQNKQLQQNPEGFLPDTKDQGKAGLQIVVFLKGGNESHGKLHAGRNPEEGQIY